MLAANDVTGIILAGGKSKRMGKDKSFLSYRGKFFIDRLLDALKDTAVSGILISVNEFDEYDSLPFRKIKDSFVDHGPLAGIYEALTVSHNNHILCVPCDMPVIDSAVLNSILSESTPHIINVTVVDQNLHPLLGVFPKTILPNLENYLKSDRKKVFDFITGVDYKLIDLSAFRNRIININTEDEYRSLINTCADE